MANQFNIPSRENFIDAGVGQQAGLQRCAARIFHAIEDGGIWRRGVRMDTPSVGRGRRAPKKEPA